MKKPNCEVAISSEKYTWTPTNCISLKSLHYSEPNPSLQKVSKQLTTIAETLQTCLFISIVEFQM